MVVIDVTYVTRFYIRRAGKLFGIDYCFTNLVSKTIENNNNRAWYTYLNSSSLIVQSTL
jgi:hypothetical protein